MSHSPLARHNARCQLDKRAVWLCGYERVVEGELHKYSNANTKSTTEAERSKADHAWRIERDIAYSAYLQLEQSQTEARKEHAQTLEDWALQPDCIRHAISPCARLTPREYHEANHVMRARHDLTWDDVFLMWNKSQQNFFGRRDPDRCGVVQVAESGCLEELRLEHESTSEVDWTDGLFDSGEDTDSSNPEMPAPTPSVESAHRKQMDSDKASRDRAKARLDIVSAWDLTIPTLWDIRRRLERNFYQRYPKEPFDTGIPDFKVQVRYSKKVNIPLALECSPYEIFQKRVSRKLTWQEVHDKALGVHVRKRDKVLSKLNHSFVGPSFAQGPRSKTSLDEAVAYCQRRKILAEPFIMERDSYLKTRVVKDMAVSQQLTNAVELLLGFTPR